MKTIQLSHFIPHDKQGQYLLLPFDMPVMTEKVAISYHYKQHKHEQHQLDRGSFTSSEKINTIDIGLIAPDGEQVGASGSAYQQIFVSETEASPGYQPYPLRTGTWKILLGAYKIAPEGVEVSLEIRFDQKQMRWLKGYLHLHSLNSDGILSLEHLGKHARAHGLDFIAITDHNQSVRRASFPKIEGLTIIPGQEWTHYLGHSNFFGVEKAYQGSYYANNEEEARQKFAQARENGALISINHPLESQVGFRYDLAKLDYDLIEVWNGPIRPRNLETIAWWDDMLKAGKKQVAVCGSDYHQDTVFQRLANPCINLLSWSNSEADLLEAVKQGRSYFTYSPTDLHAEIWVPKDGEALSQTQAGDLAEAAAAPANGAATFGDSVSWREGLTANLEVVGLEKGDELRLIDQDSQQLLFTAASQGKLSLQLPIVKPGYIRLEIWRNFFSILPILPALVSTPIWFD